MKLNDKDAMANAGRSGYTVVGWDDAGYGKKNCVWSPLSIRIVIDL